MNLLFQEVKLLRMITVGQVNPGWLSNLKFNMRLAKS